MSLLGLVYWVVAERDHSAYFGEVSFDLFQRVIAPLHRVVG